MAADFGAENGRTILGVIDERKIHLQEVHRFSNNPIQNAGHVQWDIQYLFAELKKSIAVVSHQGHTDIKSIGIDTWGVDFGLIGHDDALIENPYSYRDSRTNGMMEQAFELMPRKEIYAHTGNQFMQINTIYQLLSIAQSDRSVFDKTKRLLFMPDLFHYLLTGEQSSEYTIASTSQLLNAKLMQWDVEIFENLNIPIAIMPRLEQPGTCLGPLLPEIVEETGISPLDVVAPAGHDTACAVAAIPSQSNQSAFLSSGTWSLLGIEVDEPIINAKSCERNFTNERGYNGKIRFLRNTMGMWLLQQCQKQWKIQGEYLSYEKLIYQSKNSPEFSCIIDPDDPLFLNPPDMLAAIAEYCINTHQKVPESKGEIVRTIFESLALKYRFIIESINEMIPKPVENLHIVGGVSQNEMLNEFSAHAIGIPVIAGPVEATAAGNIMIQAITHGEISGIEEGKNLIKESFTLKRYEPQEIEKWDIYYQTIKQLFK